MRKRKPFRLPQLLRWRYVPITGLCLLVLSSIAGSTYIINTLNSSANRHSDAVFVVHDLLRNVERVQRAEARAVDDGVQPTQSFMSLFDLVEANLADIQPLLSAGQYASIERGVRTYHTAITSEFALSGDPASGDLLRVRELQTLPAGNALLDTLESLEAREGAMAHDQRASAQFWMRTFRVMTGISLCTLLLIYDHIRRKTMTRVRQQEYQFRTLIQQSSDIVLVTGIDGVIVYVTPAAEAAFGFSANELKGTLLEQFVVPDDKVGLTDLLVQSIVADGHPVKRELRFNLADGRVRTMESSAVDLIDNHAINGIVITAHDVTERKLLLESLHHQAHHDSLTGLPNRVLLADRLEQALARADRNADPIAILFLDLNEFKAVNDRFGHAAGDELLAITANKLRGAVRGTDTIARIGGDEFVIVLEQTNRAQAEVTAERIRKQLQGIVLRDEPHPVSASIGIAVRTDPLVDVDLLLRQADAAMYEMKERLRAVPHGLIALSSAAD